MAVKKFFLVGESADSAESIDISQATSFDDLKGLVGAYYAIVQPSGINFEINDTEVTELEPITASEGPIAILVDGHSVREVPGPSGLPIVGNYFEVYPDHLGNNQRLFEKYGPVFKTSNMGKTVYQTNDPTIAQIAFSESEFFSKDINEDHPLYPIKNDLAGVFLGDTKSPNWKIVHKYLPPALGPKAVRHYAPVMNKCVTDSFPVFDELDDRGEAWNVYQYMLKLSSGTVGKIMLGKDFGHFDSVDAPLSKIPLAVAELLAINKKLSTHGEWYSHLPFGDPKKLKNLNQFINDEIADSVKTAKSSGTEDLPLQDAALKADNVIDYLVRATDQNGEQLPRQNLVSATIVATGAGFTTTSSLLSWLIYGLVAYPGMQARLLQEMVDMKLTGDTVVTAEMVEEMPMLDKYIKEMQRVHNPSYQPGRTAMTDLILPGGYKLKKGSVMIVALHHLHMNPAVWDSPQKFDPDRWDTEKVKNRKKTEYIPFAFGQRMCIGFNFALLEAKIFLCKLIWKYHFEQEGDEASAEYDPFFQLIRPINLYVRTQKRQVWPSPSDSAQ
ncbi:cytochrome P450 [Polychaeton citri CBS 116435]|uniref:Cytochrome P450 n=1 Tax=Polychaeton citri CBS 116435 TaxID=1314669 RepID=A0A9P4Q9Q4_9PEZI|nr:cytochrome P450 [Polychaeton citri CBS 116435]